MQTASVHDAAVTMILRRLTTPWRGALLALAVLASAAPAADVVAIADAIQPHLAIDGNGAVTVVALRGGELVVSRSTDRGVTFAAAASITETGGKAQGGAQRGPRIGVDAQNNLYISAWLPLDRQGRPIATTTADLFLMRSTDGGQSWSRPRPINAAPGLAPENLHWMAVAPNGVVHLAWLDRQDRRRDEPGQDLFYARVVHGQPSPPRKIAALLCECCAPGLAADGIGGVLIVYREGGEKESREIFCLRSRDNGLTFDPPSQVNTTPTRETVCPMSAPAAAFDPSGRWRGFAWKDIRSGHNQVYLRQSSEAIEAGPEEAVDVHSGSEQNHPSLLLMADGQGLAAWSSKSGIGRTIELVELSSPATMRIATLDAGPWSDADYPVLAGGGGRGGPPAAGLVYEARRSGKPAALYHAIPWPAAKPGPAARSTGVLKPT